MTKPSHLVSVMLLAVAACGDNLDPQPDPGPGAPGWRELISSEWSLATTSEAWYCVSKTLQEDLYIGGFRPIDPPGTHHTALTYGPPAGPDRAPGPCDPDESQQFPFYASGVNTNELTLPEGVGVRIPAGQQIHLNLHVFNNSDVAIDGIGGVEILEVPVADVVHEAEIFISGSFGFQIPQNQMYSYGSKCRIQAEQHVFAVFPHMHQLGRHMKVELSVGGEQRTLSDQAYRFEDQRFNLFPEITLRPGDEIATTCTWFYPTTLGGPPVIGFGQSSREEMCSAIMMRYPRLIAVDDDTFCTDEQL